MLSATLPTEGWLPIRLFWRDEQPLLDWAYFGSQPLTEPFFAQSVGLCLQHPGRLLLRHQRPATELTDVPPGLPPSGFIFHMSRCGSTLVSQMLAALPHTVVVSEPPALDGVLRAHFRTPLSSEERLAWVRGIVHALLQPRTGHERHGFIKFDSWHTLDLPLLRQAFPEVPWIFVYRKPVEVLVSQMRRPASNMLPNLYAAARLGITPAQIYSLSPEEFCARALAAICQSALDQAPSPGQLINYTQLPDVVASLLDRFGIDIKEDQQEVLQAVAQRNAKAPALSFVPDSDEKRVNAAEQLTALCREWLDPLHHQLESLRTSSF